MNYETLHGKDHVVHVQKVNELKNQSLEHREDSQKAIFSLIIPTRNEVENLAPLYKRLTPILTPNNCEVIFVDDSDDNTPNLLRQQRWSFPVSVMHRSIQERKGGLSTAVLLGISHATGRFIGVMDADLQHPPELIPTLLSSAVNDKDIVIASRFVNGGSIEGLSNPLRKLGSRGTNTLAHFLFPALKNVKDTMSGFFLFDRKLLDDGTQLNPEGFKILLELLVKTNWVSLEEIPLQFQRREYGESKFNMNETLAIYMHMLRLFREKKFRRT
ncbi:MAG TPA: polyprenol monophosphomannose synthase [Patescibacteria group bacterium]|nr:polyprenol monophosphomannose synthase [Patescibacteria group bacterium]